MQILAANASTGSSLSEQAFARLRHDVLTGAHLPGAKLKVEDLQEAYGVSSSPLREALNRLSQEGLVRADDRRGFRVAAISRADLADVTHMRLLLDVEALRLSMATGDDAWEAVVVVGRRTGWRKPSCCWAMARRCWTITGASCTATFT